MKLLFLDIGGVLKKGYQDVYTFDDELINNLNILLDRVEDAYIVITDPIRINNNLSHLNNLFKGNNINRAIIGKTPYIGSYKDKKGQEILTYLINNFPACDSICIIDDIADQIENLFPTWLVKVNTKFGFTEDKILECLECFKKPLQSYNIWRINYHHDYDEY